MDLSLSDIESARQLLEGRILRTHIDYSRSCSRWVGTDIYLKFENLQKTGSFKLRGAYNKMSSLTDEEKKRGVIAASAGNHAQGVAFSASELGIPCRIVMPETSPIVKVQATQGYGAEVIQHGESFDESYAFARQLEKEKGYVFIHPFEDPKVIAGQGSIGLEILEDIPDVDSVIVAVGGGGLISGIAKVIKEKKPNTKVYGAVSSHFQAMSNLYHKEAVQDQFSEATIADGIAVKKPSQEVFASFIEKYVDGMATVSEAEIAEAIVFLLERAKTVVEGSGAVPLAAAAAMKEKWDLGKKCCIILCGGNIDLNLISQIIEKGLIRAGRVGRLTVVTSDKPGFLNQLTSIIAQHGANVLEVEHDRKAPNLNLKETAIHFLLETKSEAHLNEIIQAIKAQGGKVSV